MYPVEVKISSKNGWQYPNEAKAYYGRYSRDGVTVHWWNSPDKINDSDHDNIVNMKLNQSAQGVGSVNYVCSNNKITLMVEPENVAWCSQAGNPTTVSIEFSPHLNAEGYKKAGWLISQMEKRFGKAMKLYRHSDWFQTACLPVDTTELLTKNGWIKLKDIRVGDKVASAHIDDRTISFQKVNNVVEPYKSDTWLSRYLEATDDHRIMYSTQSRKKAGKNDVADWGDVLEKSSKQTVYLPTSGRYGGSGLPLTNDEISLLLAIQADGHYMYENRRVVDGVRIKTDDKKYFGVEFHLKKQRKIDRIIEILDGMSIDYRVNKKTDNTTSIRIYSHKLLKLADRWLDDKCLTYDWLELSDEQFEIFYDNILEWDGCRAGNDYSSSIQNNIDVVTAIMSLHNVGVATNTEKRIKFTGEYRSISPVSEIKKRIQNKLVSCVTVDSGFILIRQNGRTTIVGNCPGTLDLNRMRDEANKWNAGAYDPVVPKPPAIAKITWAKLAKPTTYRANKPTTNLWDFNNTTWNMTSVKQFKQGDEISIYGTATNETLKATYYVTQYSFDKQITNGFNRADLDEVVIVPEPPKPVEPPKEEPKEDPKPAPTVPKDDSNFEARLSALEKLVQTIVDFLSKVFKDFKK